MAKAKKEAIESVITNGATEAKPKRTRSTKTSDPAATKAKAVTSKPAAKAATKSTATASEKVGTAKPRAAKKKAEPDKLTLTRELALAAAQYAIERKAENVRLLELKDVTSITDYFVVASADTDRQVKAIAENVITEMRDQRGQSPWRTEGWDTLRWVIVDFVDFVVHVLQTESRQFYNIERLWADAPNELIEDTATKPKRASKKKAASEEDEAPAPKKSKIRVIDDIDSE